MGHAAVVATAASKIKALAVEPDLRRHGIATALLFYCAGMNLNLRSSARVIILDEDDRVLLCRFVFPRPAVPGPEKAVWAASGGGIEPRRGPADGPAP